MVEQRKSEQEPKSKSQVKREMLALQALGEELVKLTRHQLAKFPLDEELRKAIAHAQDITSHGARRRQLQFIGRLMRERDPQPLQQAMAILRHQDQQTNARQHRLEKLRDKLIAEGDAALTEVLQQYPNADRQKLRQLIRNAQQEQQQAKPPQTARLLFRYLREIMDDSADPDN